MEGEPFGVLEGWGGSWRFVSLPLLKEAPEEGKKRCYGKHFEILAKNGRARTPRSMTELIVTMSERDYGISEHRTEGLSTYPCSSKSSLL